MRIPVRNFGLDVLVEIGVEQTVAIAPPNADKPPSATGTIIVVLKMCRETFFTIESKTVLTTAVRLLCKLEANVAFHFSVSTVFFWFRFRLWS